MLSPFISEYMAAENDILYRKDDVSHFLFMFDQLMLLHISSSLTSDNFAHLFQSPRIQKLRYLKENFASNRGDKFKKRHCITHKSIDGKQVRFIFHISRIFSNCHNRDCCCSFIYDDPFFQSVPSLCARLVSGRINEKNKVEIENDSIHNNIYFYWIF